MSKDPAFLFYSSDFLTGTMLMTDEQVGKYIRLICYQHQKGRIKPKEFEKIAGGDEDLLEKFTRDNKGYYNDRLEEEIIKRSRFVESRRNNLKGKKSHMDTHMDSHMGTRMENENVNVNKDNIKESFEKFWEHYHLITQTPKTDKDPAFKHWKKLTITERRKAYEQVQNYFNSIQDKKYIKKARTYLSDKNFNDEFTPSGGASVYKADNVWEEKF